MQELENFRDEVGATIAALQPLAPKAESHPDGFKNLQIALREALRETDAIIERLEVDKRPWFRAVRTDLQDSQNTSDRRALPGEAGKEPETKSFAGRSPMTRTSKPRRWRRDGIGRVFDWRVGRMRGRASFAAEKRLSERL